VEIFISEQALIFLYMVLCGGICGVIFDLFRIIRKLFTPGAFIVFIFDIAFYALSAAGFFCFALLFNSGELRAFEFIGLAIGLTLYFLTLSYIIRKIILAFIRLLALVFRFLYRLTIPPIIFMYKPVRILAAKNKTFLKKLIIYISGKAEKSVKNLRMIKKITKKSKKALEK